MKRYLLCVTNEGFPASLESRKLYQHLPDSASEQRGFVRVIDESGEDYLYPTKLFRHISVPMAARKVLDNSVAMA